MVIFFFILKKTQFVSAEIKNGKIAILPQTPSLSDLTWSRPAKINISEKDDFSNIQHMVYDGTITASFTKEKSILILMWWIPMQSYIQKNLFLSLVTGKKFQD